MKHLFATNRAIPRLVVALLLIVGASGQIQAREPGEQPIGWSKLRVANSPIKPIYASEIEKDTESVRAKVDEMAKAVGEAKVNPEADSVEKAWPGSISLERHKADIAEIQDKFSLCTAAMQHQIQDAEASGKATRADRARFKTCMDHCNSILGTMSDIHYNTSAMLTATKKVYFLDGWEKHQKLMAHLQEQMKACPMMMKETMACCANLTGATKPKAMPGAASHDHGTTGTAKPGKAR
jgi:hypothetical protein